MKITITATVNADDDSEALEQFQQKMDIANEKFQIDAGNPPDLKWAKAVGLKFKDFIPGYGYKLIIKDWADTDNFNGPSCFTDSVVFTTEELAKRALRLAFITKADGYCDVDGGLLTPDKTDVIQDCDDLARVLLTENKASVMFIDGCGFGLKIQRVKLANLKHKPLENIGKHIADNEITKEIQEIDAKLIKAIDRGHDDYDKI
jgi:hypothetical protein